MTSRRLVPGPIANLARQQAGVVSTAQLRANGMTKTQIARLVGDVWQRIDKGLYYTNTSDVPWKALVWAGYIAGGDDAVACGRTAARLFGLIDDDERPIVIMVPRERSPQRRWFVEYRRATVGIRRTQTRQGIRCTSVADTVLDVCASGTVQDVVALISRAIQQRLTSGRQLAAAMDRRRAVKFRPEIIAMISDAADGAHSPLEVEYLRKVERAHGLPKGRRQRHAGNAKQWVDVIYRAYGLIVELDGEATHRRAAFRDRTRDNANAKVGWTTLRFGWHEIMADPCGVAAQIIEALIARGWRGIPAQCSTCAA
ncbi:type IV toxin-antitoxin system AbiEi family antitoxin domain-containing protein [Antricoccus suffuscus]|nr:type IV toxin-antitoxin system AbiEi family antitoxin domain-containing protein [Antricoccus suffuscus]